VPVAVSHGVRRAPGGGREDALHRDGGEAFDAELLGQDEALGMPQANVGGPGEGGELLQGPEKADERGGVE
jgi:hypothetical protein